jgi:hypothetical protein
VNPPQHRVDHLRHVLVTVILGPALAAQQGLLELADMSGWSNGPRLLQPIGVFADLVDASGRAEAR